MGQVLAMQWNDKRTWFKNVNNVTFNRRVLTLIYIIFGKCSLFIPKSRTFEKENMHYYSYSNSWTEKRAHFLWIPLKFVCNEHDIGSWFHFSFWLQKNQHRKELNVTNVERIKTQLPLSHIIIIIILLWFFVDYVSSVHSPYAFDKVLMAFHFILQNENGIYEALQSKMKEMKNKI